jgi:hypothetical protein
VLIDQTSMPTSTAQSILLYVRARLVGVGSAGGADTTNNVAALARAPAPIGRVVVRERVSGTGAGAEEGRGRGDVLVGTVGVNTSAAGSVIVLGGGS